MKAGMLFVALLATGLAQAGQASLRDVAPQETLIRLAPMWSFMGNGGPLALPGRCEIGIDSEKSSDAPTTYSVRCPSTVLPSFGGARMNFDPAPFRGKRVRISASLMAADIGSVANPQYPNVAGEGGLWIGVGTPRDGVRSDRMEDRTIKGTTDWVVRDFVMDMPADASQLQAGFWMHGKGQIWVRDLKVQEVPGTVPVNFERTAPKAGSGPDLGLAVLTAPRAEDVFLPPPQKWLGLGESNFELCDTGVDAKMLAAGQRNLSISCPVPVRAYLRQAFEAPAWWGKRVRLSAWVKAENVVPRLEGGNQAGAALYLSASDTNGPIYNAVLTGTTDWTQLELVADIPAGAPYIPIGISLNGTGQVWARDLKFEEVSRDTPVSLLPQPNR